MKTLTVVILLICSPFVFAKGVSPYLPLNLAPEIEHHIEQVVALTSDTPIIKPYRAADITSRVKQIEKKYPALASRVNGYLSRYGKRAAITNASVEASISSDTDSALANRRNQGVDESYSFSASAHTYLNPNVLASVGSTFSQDNKITHQNTYLAVGWSQFQVDFGYREHWFSPFEDSAMLISTNAKSSPSLTVSNAVPLTKWGLRYELFYSILEPVDGIVLGDELFPGSPRLGGFHLSVNPLDNWTVGFNRTLQFGGGARDVTFSDFIGAFFDPAGRDNVGDIESDDPNLEFGNQQASVTTRLNLNWGIPFSVYGEYAGEDTVNNSNFSLGNVATSLGIFFPFVTEDISFRAEYVDFTDAWYVHHLYPDGYTNDGQIIGNFAASFRESGSGTSGRTLALRSLWNIKANQLLDVRLRAIQLDDTINESYETGSFFSVAYSYATQYGIFGIEGMYAREPLGDSVSRLAIFYRW